MMVGPSLQRSFRQVNTASVERQALASHLQGLTL
jgi:hypothetical protein